MIPRILIAAVFCPVWVYAAFYRQTIYYSLFVGLSVLISLMEYFKLLELKGYRPFLRWGAVCGVALSLTPERFFFLLAGRFFLTVPEAMVFVLTVFTIGVLLLGLRQDLAQGVHNTLLTLSGVLYIGFLGSFFIQLRDLTDGGYFVFILFLFTWVYDGGAYFTGKMFGRRPLAPVLSPKKTVEGFLGGFVFCAAVFLIVKLTVMPQMPVSVAHGLVLTLLMGFMGQMGDLSESMIKRYAGVKDSGQIFPEYGGFLDKLDSLLFTAPTLYYYAVFVLGVR